MKEGDAKAMGAFLKYVLGDGQDQLSQLQYAKLPSDAARARPRPPRAALTCNGSSIAGLIPAWP